MIALLASLFLTNPIPLELPRAEAYLVREKGVYRLEDRYNKSDLWLSRSVDGRWVDDDYRVFVKAHLDVLPPEGDAGKERATRVDYVEGRVGIAKKDMKALRTAIAALVPFELPEKPRPPRQMPRGMKDADYWQGTNETTIVCAYLPEKTDVWQLAIWQLAEGDDYPQALKTFEDEYFTEDNLKALAYETRAKTAKKAPKASERELLRADARHSIAAYESWHATDGEEFEILDDLPTREIIPVLTNDLHQMRAKYAAALPTHLDGTNVLAVARIYGDRAEYLEALEVEGHTNLAWSAAYWSPTRRELVAHLGESEAEFIRTMRHEAFHQYLSYATSMITVSPWLNEGYAQYFEDEESRAWKLPRPTFSDEELARLAESLPALMQMDYAEFYAGTSLERSLKYRLAWSIAVFLENGADEVRNKPFKNLKKDYFDALFRTKDMRQATLYALPSKDLREKFVAAWLKFWKEN